MIASELMTRSPVALDATAPLSKAADLLASLDIRHLPVVDTDGALVGMLSDRDLRGQKAMDAAAATIMTAPVLCAQPTTDLATIVELMLDYKIGAVPIVEPDKTLVGIVSYIDVLRALAHAA